MELLYLWVEEYKNIKQQGFNFSPKHNFELIKTGEFDEDNKPKYKLIDHMTDKDRENIPDNFFGDNISNITAIIGKNGSGKSSIIELIRLALNFELMSNKNLIIIFSDKGKIVLFPNSVVFSDINIEKLTIVDDYKLYKNKINTLTYSGMFNSYRESLKHIGDRSISTEYLLKHTIKNNKNNNLLGFYEFFSNDIRSQLDFLCNKLRFFKASNSVFINYINNLKSLKSIKLTFDIIDYKAKYYNEIGNSLGVIDKETVHYKIERLFSSNIHIEKSKNKIFLRLFNQLMFMLIYQLATDIKNKKMTSSIFNNFFIDPENSENNLLTLIKIIKENKNYYLYSQSEGLQSEPLSSKCIRVIEEVLIDSVVEEDEIIINNKYRFKMITDRDMDSFGLMFDISLDTFEYISELTLSLGDKIKWGWDKNLSNGESSLLNILGRFVYKVNDLENNNIIIFFDEIEVGLHPEWQRNFIVFIKEIFKFLYRGKKIEIILISHSPFIASDLPKDNVIMLDTFKEGEDENQEEGNCKVVKEVDKIETFGANIFDLFRDAFFVESNFGEFAKEKIKDVVKLLTPNENGEYKEEIEDKKKYIKYVISSIGEKIIKNKLQSMYDEYLDSKQLSKKEKIELAIENSGFSREEFLNHLKG